VRAVLMGAGRGGGGAWEVLEPLGLQSRRLRIPAFASVSHVGPPMSAAPVSRVLPPAADAIVPSSARLANGLLAAHALPTVAVGPCQVT
jgi:hypothetical protein